MFMKSSLYSTKHIQDQRGKSGIEGQQPIYEQISDINITDQSRLQKTILTRGDIYQKKYLMITNPRFNLHNL